MRKAIKGISKCLVLIVTLLAASGCAEHAVIHDNQRYILNEQLALPQSHGDAAVFNTRVIFMADQLERNLDRKNLAETFIVTSFVDLGRKPETSQFGRLLAENLIHELQVRRWQVFEVRLTKDVILQDKEEFLLSRDFKQLQEQYKVGGIVTGTYSVSSGNIIVNTRVVDAKSGIVVGTAQTLIPVTPFADYLLQKEEGVKAMKIVGESSAPL